MSPLYNLFGDLALEATSTNIDGNLSSIDTNTADIESELVTANAALVHGHWARCGWQLESAAVAQGHGPQSLLLSHPEYLRVCDDLVCSGAH